jgi:sulfide:quinone oxidoreductase
VIAGGGVAGLETALALRALAGKRVAITLVAPEHDFVSVAQGNREAFGGKRATRRKLSSFAGRFGLELVHDRVRGVDHREHEVTTELGQAIAYDILVVAVGANRSPAFDHVLTVRSVDDIEALHGVIQDMEEGYCRRLGFIVPTGATWTLPLYELALMAATRATEMCVAVELTVMTPEAAPLEVFGADVSGAVGALLAEHGVQLEAGVHAAVEGGRWVILDGTRRLHFDRLVSLPRLHGVELEGIPHDDDGFIPVDGSGRVVGVGDVFAAGDATQFAIKQGGVATQEADIVAQTIAQQVGAQVELQIPDPTLRGILRTGRGDRFLRRHGTTSEITTQPLWWPPEKVAGQYLAPYLAGSALPDRARARGGVASLFAERRPVVKRRLDITADRVGHARLELRDTSPLGRDATPRP